MPKLCINADIQSTPCEGGVHSRTIKCKAGHATDCLRDCSEKCPSYRAAEQRKSILPEQYSPYTKSPVYNPTNAPKTTTGSSTPRQGGRVTPFNTPVTQTKGRSCGGCGQNVASQPHTNKSW